MKASIAMKQSLNRYWVASAISLLFFTVAIGTAHAGTQNNTYVVTWSTANVNNDCVASGGFGSWGGAKSTSGSLTFSPINPAGSYTFSMTCTGAAGSNYAGSPITANAPLTISPANVRMGISPKGGANPLYTAPTLDFRSNRTWVSHTSGQSTFNLTWSYSDPRGSCTASNSWSGTKEAAGSATFSNDNYEIDWDTADTYTISCNAPGKPTLTGSVTVVKYGRPCTNKFGGCIIN